MVTKKEDKSSDMTSKRYKELVYIRDAAQVIIDDCILNLATLIDMQKNKNVSKWPGSSFSITLIRRRLYTAAHEFDTLVESLIKEMK